MPQHGLESIRCSGPLRLAEAAAFLRCSPRSLANRSWRIRHAIPTLRLGRCLLFDRAELQCWLKGRREISVASVAGASTDGEEARR